MIINDKVAAVGLVTKTVKERLRIEVVWRIVRDVVRKNPVALSRIFLHLLPITFLWLIGHPKSSKGLHGLGRALQAEACRSYVDSCAGWFLIIR